MRCLDPANLQNMLMIKVGHSRIHPRFKRSVTALLFVR
jgi:hypothetical protein